MKCDKCRYKRDHICRATLNPIKHESCKNGRCGTDGLLFEKRKPSVIYENPRGQMQLRPGAVNSMKGRRKWEEVMEDKRVREETEWL